MKNNKDYISSLLSNNGYIAVNRALIKGLGLNCAVLIGELCSEYNYYSENNQLTNKEWFYSTVPNIEENTGLNKYFQEESIKILKKHNIIETKVMGMPSKRYFRINFAEIEKIFKNANKNTKNTKKMPKNQGSNIVATKEANQSPPRKQTSRHQGSNIVAIKEATQLPPRKRHSRQHGGEPVATNNNNNNNKLININNNLILSKKTIRKDEIDKHWHNYENYLKNINKFHKNIKIEIMRKEYNKKPLSKNILEDIVSICESILENSNQQKYYMISGSKISSKDFINRILKLNETHIEYIVESLNNNSTKIKNIKAYMLATIYNAIDTIETYYKNLINFDMSKNNDIFVA